jgi:RimJ/RimL family protein N-acetyltransferase
LEGESVRGWAIEWRRAGELLQITEPTAEEVAAVAPLLAAFYNDAHNRRLLANTQTLTEGDVIDVFRDCHAAGGRPLLLWRDGRLVGDADLRRVDLAGGTAEFAILIGDRAQQGRGLGTRFAAMAHVFAFTTLGFQRLYIAIVADNPGSRRLFQKLGYEGDDSVLARAGADASDDVTLSCSRARFESLWASATFDVRVARRA